MISVATLIAVATVLWQTHQVKQRQYQILQLISIINQSMEQIGVCITHSNTAEQNTIKALNEICEALNRYFATATEYMNDSAFALQHVAVCMVPIMDKELSNAVENEDYERAKTCTEILSHLQRIIKPISNK